MAQATAQYCTPIPDRLLQPICVAEVRADTRRLAIILCRLVYGFRLSKALVTKKQLQNLGFNSKSILVHMMEVKALNWFDVKINEEDFVISRHLELQYYNDHGPSIRNEQLHSIGVINYGEKENRYGAQYFPTTRTNKFPH